MFKTRNITFFSILNVQHCLCFCIDISWYLMVELGIYHEFAYLRRLFRIQFISYTFAHGIPETFCCNKTFSKNKGNYLIYQKNSVKIKKIYGNL